MASLSALHGTLATVVLCALLFVDETVVPVPLLPNELLLCIGGALISTGVLVPWIFVPAALVAMSVGMLVGYSWARFAGRHGIGTVVRRLHMESAYEQVQSRLETAGPLGIAITRLLPGIRPWATLSCGATGVAPRVFLLGALPALVLWEGVWISLGVAIGLPAERFLDTFEQLILRGVILMVLGLAGYHSLARLAPRDAAVPQWRALWVPVAVLIAGGAVACMAAGVLAVGRGLARSHHTTWVDALLVGAVAVIAAVVSLVRNRAPNCDPPTPPRENPHRQFTRPRWLGPRSGPTSPSYHLPPSMILRLVYSSLLHRGRDLFCDAESLAAGMNPQPVVMGVKHVPRSGPCVILPNHYERRDGVWVGWGAIVITAALAERRPRSSRIRWIMTSSWEDCYLGPWRVPPGWLCWILRRLAHLYGIILMPSDPEEVFGRGEALLKVFRALDDPCGQVIAFHPEAGGFETMIGPTPGVGQLLAAIDRHKVPCIPTGVFEQHGHLTVRFGPPFSVGVFSDLGAQEAAETAMIGIARLVPAATQGVFMERVSALAASEHPMCLSSDAL